jgi:hypothetical protein
MKKLVVTALTCWESSRWVCVSATPVYKRAKNTPTTAHSAGRGSATFKTLEVPTANVLRQTTTIYISGYRPSHLKLSLVINKIVLNGYHVDYMYYTFTVKSRDYMPPFCMLALGKSGEGAYTRDSDISVWRPLPTDKCHMGAQSLAVWWAISRKTREKWLK